MPGTIARRKWVLFTWFLLRYMEVMTPMNVGVPSDRQ